ncbi:hypothetical protein HaLaN_18304, partial [Haematococcus lacustris]
MDAPKLAVWRSVASAARIVVCCPHCGVLPAVWPVLYVGQGVASWLVWKNK